MKKIIEAIKWIVRNSLLITVAGFIIIYLRWFKLTPLIFYNDPDGAYIVGLILLGIFGFFVMLLKLARNRAVVKIILLVPTILFFLGNITHIIAFFPSMEFTTKCNGNTYYITWMHPFGDYQWTFYNVTIWKGVFKYKSFFFGYSPGAGPYKVICDEERNEANIVSTFTEALAYTDGANPRRYDRYVGTSLKTHRYFLAWQCNDRLPTICGSETFILYQCNLGYTSCKSLPISYTGESVDYLILEANEETNEIELYDDFKEDGGILIFTYGEHPRCYVEGCEILKE